MKWDLLYGEHLEHFLEIEADTGTTPDPLKNRPEIPFHLGPIMEAFWLLSAGRQPAFDGAGPISTTDIISIGKIIEPSDVFRFLRVIRSMDAILLKHVANRPKSK